MTDAKSISPTEKVERLINIIDKMVEPIAESVAEMNAVKGKVDKAANAAEDQAKELKKLRVGMRWFLAGLTALTVANGAVQYLSALYSVGQAQISENSINGLKKDISAFLGANAKLGEAVGASVEAKADLSEQTSAATVSAVKKSIEAQEEFLRAQVAVSADSGHEEKEKAKERLKGVLEKKEKMFGKDEGVGGQMSAE